MEDLGSKMFSSGKDIKNKCASTWQPHVKVSSVQYLLAQFQTDLLKFSQQCQK